MRATLVNLLSAAALTAAAGLGGCVTEVVPVRPASSGPANGPMNSSPMTASTPIAGGSTSTSRVAAAIKPLGAIPYDGLTLPLVSPDGRWIVTQIGSLPPWESVLAESGAKPVPSNAIAAFEVVDGTLRAAAWAVPAAETPSPTVGLLLGRSAENGWTLVERPNENGSRWIGRLDLATGAVEWLVQDEAVNAQALLLRDGTLIYTRRAVSEPASELVIQPSQAADVPADAQHAPAAQTRTVRREGWRFCQPVATPDQSIVAVLAISAQEAELLAYSTTQADAAGLPLLVGRESLGPLSAAAAYQSVAPVETCPPAIDSPLKSTILLVNADRRRLAMWDPIRASMNLLPVNVMAATRVHSPIASGLVMASSKGLDFWSGLGVPARLLAGSYLPRSYNDPDGSGSRLLILSPQTDSAAPALRVLAVEMVAPTP